MGRTVDGSCQSPPVRGVVAEAGHQEMGRSCAVPSSLWPSVKWEQVLLCLSHEALAEERVEKRLRCYPNISGHQKGHYVEEACWGSGGVVTK